MVAGGKRFKVIWRTERTEILQPLPIPILIGFVLVVGIAIPDVAEPVAMPPIAMVVLEVMAP